MRRGFPLRQALGGGAFAAAVVAFFWVGTLAGVGAGLVPPAQAPAMARR